MTLGHGSNCVPGMPQRSGAVHRKREWRGGCEPGRVARGARQCPSSASTIEAGYAAEPHYPQLYGQCSHGPASLLKLRATNPRRAAVRDAPVRPTATHLSPVIMFPFDYGFALRADTLQ